MYEKNFKLGFGCMRPPMKDGEPDAAEFSRMVDAYIEAGFNYFDTAHGYVSGKNEAMLKTCLTSRYPREAYILTDKLSTNFFKTEEEILPLFEKQLEECGVEYFDYYLMHAQDRILYEKYKSCNAYEIALGLKEQGKIKHFGISFHDTAEVLEQILCDYPQIEVVQIQFNYADYYDPAVQSRKVYETCRKYGKPVIIMEPVKGGCLVNLPDEAKAVFDELGTRSYASYAIRFAAGFEGVMSVLSGMGSMEMVEDNVNSIKNFVPLNEKELEAIDKVRAIFAAKDTIPCTACKYCVDSCPKNIPIPELFGCLNSKRMYNNWSASYYYNVHTRNGGSAGTCIKCGKCETFCPQHLKIRDLLETVAEEFEKK